VKRVLTILFCLLAIGAAAQVRSYGDMDSKTFVIGLDSYFFGPSGSLDFTCGGQSFRGSIAGTQVSVNGSALPVGSGEKLIGVHDFTGDGAVELVVGTRGGNAVAAYIFQYAGGAWKQIGKIGASGDGVSEIRVFRGALTVKDKNSGALHTWTCHNGKFDFKSSGGGPDPTPSNL